MSDSAFTNELMAAGLAWLPASLLGDIQGDVTSVLEYGATGNGVTDDTKAFAAAFNAVGTAGGGTVSIPPGNYLLSSPVALWSNTLVAGSGAASVVTASSTWVDPGTYGTDPYMFFTNKNYGAVPIVDDNIAIQNLSFLWTNQNTGAAHSIRFVCASNIKVMNCRSDGGGDHTALRGCTDTLIFGCSAYNGKNAAYDHWGYNGLGPTNARIIACYAQTANAGYQFVNFNAVSSENPQPTVADGCIIANNEFVYTGATQGIPINLNPMGSGNTTKNIIVANNKMTGNILVTARGNCQAVSVSDNVMDVGGLTNAAIAFYTDGTDFPANISVTGNVIINPATSGANLGVIRVTCNGHFISGNTVTGSSFQTACYTSGFTGVIGPNNFSTGTGSVIATTLDTSLIGDLILTNQNAVSWFDTANNRPRMYVQNDNNLVFYGTNGSGGTKFIFSNQQNAAGGNFIIGPGLQVAELSVNNMQLLGNSTGSPVRLIAGGVGSDTNIAVQVTAKGNSGVMSTGYTRGTKPTTTDIPTGYGAVWSNSNDSSIKLYFNLAGTLYASPTLTTGNA